jgi:hypothetical protein
MRQELLDPLRDNPHLTTVTEIARRIYELHEGGHDYALPRARLSELAGVPITKADVCGAFGSISPESFAQQILLDPSMVPVDLTEEEMLELLERIYAADGSEFQIDFWVECLRVNTGDTRICDLIFWPNYYLGDDDLHRELSPRETLDIALEAGREHRGSVEAQTFRSELA